MAVLSFLENRGRFTFLLDIEKPCYTCSFTICYFLSHTNYDENNDTIIQRFAVDFGSVWIARYFCMFPFKFLFETGQ